VLKILPDSMVQEISCTKRAEKLRITSFQLNVKKKQLPNQDSCGGGSRIDEGDQNNIDEMGKLRFRARFR